MCDKIDVDKPQDNYYATDDYSEVCEYTPPEPDYESIPQCFQDAVEQFVNTITDARENEERNEEGSVFTGRTETSDGGDDED